MSERYIRFSVPFIIGFSLCLIASSLAPHDGFIGHDYSHALPRLYLGSIHFWQNGPFSLPHFTPSLCAGIPFFADPQSEYFSLIQLISLKTDPFFAAQFSILVFYLLSYFGWLLFFRRVLNYHPISAHLGALAFLLNGFAFVHLLEGHLTHHPYLLIPFLLYFVFKKPESSARELMLDIIGFSLIWIYTFYSGGLHMMIVFTFVMILILPLAVISNSNQSNRSQIYHLFLLFLGTAVIFGLGCSGKLIESAHFAPYFHAESINRSNDPFFTQLNRYFWFTPRRTPMSLPFGQNPFGMWEYVGYITKLTIPALIAFVFLIDWKKHRNRFLAVVYAVLIPVYFWIALGKQGYESIPVLGHYHNPIKLLSALIPLLIWIFSYVVHGGISKMELTGMGERAPVLFFFATAAILVLESSVYMDSFTSQGIGLTFRYEPSINEQIKSRGSLVPVSEIVSQRGSDLTGILSGHSSLLCYEPLFGYHLEELKSSASIGPTNQIIDGQYNVTHPGCLLYPDFYHCKPWDRIAESEKIARDKFISGDASAFLLPRWQTILYAINFIGLTAVILFWVGSLTHRIFVAALVRRP